MRFLVGRARRAKRGKGMFDGELTSFWNSLQQAEQRIEAEATEAERNLYRTVYGYKSRVMRLRAALAASGPLARQVVARKLEGIKLDAIWDILFSAVRDMALYYGGSVVLGTAVGAGLGSLAGGVGAIPGAALGFEAGNLLGEWVMMFLGLKMLAEGLTNTIPTALRLYVQGFRLAWGPVEGDRPDARYSADYQHGESMAAHRFAEGHVLMIMGILIAMVAYLLRGKSEEALMQAVRKSERLGTKMADWLAENKEKLLKEESLKPKAAERAPSQETEPDPLSKKTRGPQGTVVKGEGTYGELKGNLEDGFQAHHLNQNAAYSSVIPKNEGFAIGIRGNAFTEPGTPHYEFHSSLEGFWDQYRRGGDLFGEVPTNAQYGDAVSQALQDSGLSSSEAQRLSNLAAQNRAAYGLSPDDLVPNIPRKIYQSTGP